MTLAAPMEPTASPPHVSTSGQLLVRRIRFLAAMAVSGLIFWYFGWWVASPPDPRSAVALLMVDQGVVTMAELLGLAVVVSGLAVAICGANSAERGPLAVAVGLATLAARSGQMDKLILYRATSAAPGAGPESVFPTFGFIAETWLWLALIGVGLVVGRWVESWFTPVPAPATLHPPADPGKDIKQGAGTIALSALISWVMLGFVLGTPEYPIDKGQIYFGIAFAFLVAGLISHWLFQMTTRVWMLVVVALVTTGAYLFTGPDRAALDAALKTGAYVALPPLARPLPIEYAALGAIGVLFERDVMGMVASMFGVTLADESKP